MSIDIASVSNIPSPVPVAVSRADQSAPAPAASANVPAPQPSASEVQSAARQLQHYSANSGRTLEFQVDDQSGLTVVTVKDSSTGDVIRQIPNEEVVRLARLIQQDFHASNALLNVKA